MLKISRIIVSLVTIVASLIASGPPSGIQPAAAYNAGVNLPPLAETERGNLKLDSVLNQLIEAGKRLNRFINSGKGGGK